MAELTTIILTREKSDKITSCFNSLKSLRTRIIIIIDTKKDNTEAEMFAKNKKVKYFKHEINNNFAMHREFALSKVKTKYVFYIDDDEEVTQALIKDIKKILSGEIEGNAFAVPRKNIIFGKEFKHTGQWPDYVARIFKKEKLNGFHGEVHEQPIVDGQIVHLKSPLIHYKHNDLSSMVEKTNKWSEIEARLMFEAHHPPMTIARFASASFREFWLRMIQQKAFLDGPEGIIYALYQIFSRFISYAKLWEMQLKLKS